MIAGASAAYVALASPAHAAGKFEFDIAAGSLDIALVSLARQARVSIEVDDPAMQSVRVGGLKGRFTLREALRRLLRGTGYDFAITVDQVVRLVPLRPPKTAMPEPQRPAGKISSSAGRAAPPPPEPIIVTATKQNASLADYPGGVHVATFDVARSFRFGGRGSEVLLRDLPNLSSTELGSGRNKIFIRGIADSSFNGKTQSTIGLYLGESRLIYSAPDPDLALYDIERVEVVEGPHGTLYGAGSLGGVIRITPSPPELGLTSLSATGALSLTGNELGGDGAVVANLAVGNNAAFRLVGYHARRPGYIDDIQRGIPDINRTAVSGLRATLRLQPTDQITIDFGVVGQNTGSKDGQYTDSAGPALTRRSFVAQPFDNDYRLAFATGRARLGEVQLVSNTSYTYHSIDTLFDATSPIERIPTVFEEDTRVSLLTHETRISGTSGRVSRWVAGISVVRNVNHIKRLLGPPDRLGQLSSVRSATLDAAVFGEATAPVWRTFSMTAGGRLSYVRQIDELAPPLNATGLEPVRSQVRFLPTVALSWKPKPGIIGYLRYQEGFRPGAQQLAGTGLQTSVIRFESDEIHTTEVGLRFGAGPGSRFRGGLSFAYSRWDQVQADLVTPEGFPYVSNLGSGFVRYVSADLIWQPFTALSLEASGFLTSAKLDRPAPAFESAVERDLPNVADSGWRLTGRWEPRIGDTQMSFDASLGYIGTSQLAIGAPFEFSQGNYLDTSIGARADFGAWGLSLDVENLFNSRANRFSYGNPFSVALGNQRTPLAPRTIRIGLDVRY